MNEPFKKALLRKLSSRKLWAAIAAFACTLVLGFAGDKLPAETAALLQKGIAALCVYIGGESLVDAAAVFRGE